MQPTDHIQIVTFRLAGIDADAYRAHAESVAPKFTEIPGLRAKAWLADEESGTFGGVYAWESRDAMEAYIRGPVFGALQENPVLADVETRDFAVLDRPTRITRRRYRSKEFAIAP
jgi:heme-degrading monooxygenase HmoA